MLTTAERLLTPQEVADNLVVSVFTVKAWCRTGKLPAYRIGGSQWRIRSDDLEAFAFRQPNSPRTGEGDSAR